MCGFAGELVFPPGRADVDLACKMAARLTHRGPDDQGSFISTDGRCAIGFRRLAVIDPPGSHQPMSLADGELTVAFNGEIYNYQALRDELSRQGAIFTTAGDTEVLLHLYRRDGRDMLKCLEGMFALALYDQRRGSLLLARDRLGQKPLWYAVGGDRVVFASEAKALLEHPKIEGEVDEAFITAYLSMGYIASPQSAWRGVCKLPPAHSALVCDASFRPDRYWSPETISLPSSRRGLVERVREVVTRAVESRMAADVPLGALLSGGVDSSIVVALMSRAAGRAGGVKTFTAGFEQGGFDERPAARAVAEHCGSEHRELIVCAAPAEMLDALVDMYDEPFGDSSALATWLICRAARRHVTVALVGDGGDEAFAGYDRHRAMLLAETMGPARYLAVRVAAAAARPWAPHDERNPLRRFVRFAEALTDPPAVQYFRHRRLFSPDDLKCLLTEDFAAKLELAAAAEWFCDLYEGGDLPDEVARSQRHDMLTYLPDDLLVKTDIASMAASLELRSPLLDHRVMSLGLSLPAEAKVGLRRGKLILREAFGDLLPAGVFARRKRGFAVPLGDWLGKGLAGPLRETLLGPELRRLGIFREEALLGLINDHMSGRGDHRHRLWALLMLGRWLLRQPGR